MNGRKAKGKREAKKNSSRPINCLHWISPLLLTPVKKEQMYRPIYCNKMRVKVCSELVGWFPKISLPG